MKCLANDLLNLSTLVFEKAAQTVDLPFLQVTIVSHPHQASEPSDIQSFRGYILLFCAKPRAN